jgi:N-acetylglucosaminyl-diphospho-decaprenol L-rhamnosyltransferase
VVFLPRPDLRVSVIVLFHGQPRLTLACLKSLIQTEALNAVEVILVDNGSSRADSDLVLRGIADEGIVVEQIVQLPKNVGFSRGMNAGIELATGDAILALNSDTVVGANVFNLLQYELRDCPGDAAFFAVPVFDLLNESNSRSGVLQCEVTALTSYISCQPVAAAQLASTHVLGPPGPAILMSRFFVNAMISEYGFVFNPDFFLYGEDVDLFLRARRRGFRTVVVPARIERDEVIWHRGSASSSDSKQTLDKSPDIAAHVLDGCVRNIWGHAGWVELVPLLSIHLCFRLAFAILYARRHSWKLAVKLFRSPVARPRYRRLARFREPLFLTKLVALAHRRILPWARSTDLEMARCESPKQVSAI